MLVLALVEADRSPPAGTHVLYRFSATPSDMSDTERQTVDVAAVVGHGDHVAPLLTLAEVARILRVDPRTVQRYVSDGRLAAVTLGRQHRVEPADLAAFVAEHRQAASR